MERSRVTLAVLIYVLLLRGNEVYGAEIEEIKVKPGNNITISCDRPLTTGFNIVWIRNCSHEHQPSLIIDNKKMYDMYENLPRFRFPQNPKTNSIDLQISNITISDLGLYNCALRERKIKRDKGGNIYSSDVYHYGNRTTLLSLAVPETSCPGPVTTVSPPPVSECFICWTLFFSICPICVLFCLICVYCLCQEKCTGDGTDHKKELDERRNTLEGEVVTEVCYSSLDVTTRRPKILKKQRSQRCDFSVYAPVRTDSQNF